MDALTARGVTAELVDLSEFPTRLALSMQFDQGTHQFHLTRRDGGTLDLNAVRTAWWRRPQPFKLPETMTDPVYRQFALSESSTAFQGLYQSLDAVWLNDPVHDAAAAHKPYQLQIAQRVGLEIPRTLMTNDPDAARAFWAANPGEVIYKQFIALPDAWRETRRLRDDEQALADSISFAPVIFQRHVPAVADLRVIGIGDVLFAAAADVRDAPYPQDVRVNIETKYIEHRLPHDVADKLRNLTESPRPGLRCRRFSIDRRRTLRFSRNQSRWAIPLYRTGDRPARCRNAGSLLGRG